MIFNEGLMVAQDVKKPFKTDCPMGNHIKNLVAHIKVTVVIRYKMNENLCKLLHVGHSRR